MLSLSRKIGESIIINDNVVCTVLEVSGRIVRLGFEYPSTATVYRQELYERIQQENILASQNVEEISDSIKIPPKLRVGEK
jgi:carbon storage regulator